MSDNHRHNRHDRRYREALERRGIDPDEALPGTASVIAAPIPLLLTIRDVCRVLNVSDTTVYRLMRSGSIKPRKIGRKTLFRAEDIGAFVESLPDAA